MGPQGGFAGFCARDRYSGFSVCAGYVRTCAGGIRPLMCAVSIRRARGFPGESIFGTSPQIPPISMFYPSALRAGPMTLAGSAACALRRALPRLAPRRPTQGVLPHRTRPVIRTRRRQYAVPHLTNLMYRTHQGQSVSPRPFRCGTLARHFSEERRFAPDAEPDGRRKPSSETHTNSAPAPRGAFAPVYPRGWVRSRRRGFCLSLPLISAPAAVRGSAPAESASCGARELR